MAALSPDVAGAPVRLTCVVGDITERRETRERMARLQSDLAHIGRLTEMGEMVSAFAHELRQPLTAGNNYLAATRRYLKHENVPLDRVRDLIDKIDGQFARATQIIQRIRGFATKGDTERAKEDVRALIHEAVELARLDPRHRGTAVHIETDAALPQVIVDKVQIQQVLLNLLRNGFEAMDGMKRRVVTLRAQPAGDGKAVEISVSDTGPGLSPDVAARLFQPFVTTKASGMGVGLSICRTIIDGHGGKMWADSEPGKGATFHLTVPVA